MSLIKNTTAFIYLVLCLFLIVSCSNTKYSYRKKISVNHEEAKEITKPAKSIAPTDINNVAEKENVFAAIVVSEETTTAPAVMKTFSQKEWISNSPVLMPDPAIAKQDTTRMKAGAHPFKKKNNGFTALGFITALLLLWLALLALRNKNDGVYLSAAVFVAPVSFVLNLIGLSETIKERDKYAGLGLAIFGIIIAAAWIVTLLILW